jgi:hypothetical protein
MRGRPGKILLDARLREQQRVANVTSRGDNGSRRLGEELLRSRNVALDTKLRRSLRICPGHNRGQPQVTGNQVFHDGQSSTFIRLVAGPARTPTEFWSCYAVNAFLISSVTSAVSLRM